MTTENLRFLKQSFASGQTVDNIVKKQIVGQTIIDFLFCYDETESQTDRPGYIHLPNGYYITENNFGTVGLDDIRLMIFDNKALLSRNERLKIETHSFLKTKKTI